MGNKKLLITIDGPAGAGKTSVSRLLAARLGYTYVDTGALYRGIALEARQRGISSNDDDGLAQLCGAMTLGFISDGSGSRLLVNGTDVTDRIRTPEISMLASAISARPVVRTFLLDVQRRMGAARAAVFEGRDMGTVVFPEADLKFFLDASPKIRALRRFRELAKDPAVTLEKVEKEMIRRDENDSSRAVAPLRPAEDAIRIDSTDKTLDGVIDEMMTWIAPVQS